MTDVKSFAILVLVVAAIGLLAVLSNRLSERVHLPAPALFLAVAAVTEKLVSVLPAPPEQLVERVVTVALLCILFDGGLHLGWRRFRSAATPITAIGIVGTFLTAGAAAALCHYAFGLNWYLSLLLGTAVSPTDPAVVFSVLGRREIAGRSGAILEGESGANDPVGIALMASLITAGGVSSSGFLHVAGEFLLQMGVGGAVGVVGGRALLWFIRRVPLPAEGLYPLRTLASAFVLYGIATLALGSGFLAVFVAGIILGDARAPFKLEIERFHSALASLAEIVAFIILGLTVDLDELGHADVWIPGLVLGAAVSIVIRPVLVGLCLWPTKLERNERTFILFAGLKGAVPILLASYLLAAGIQQGQRLYGIVVVVVAFSVIFQAGLVPTVARLLRLPMHTIEVEPWALGVRLPDEPEGVDRFTICPGSPADGRTVEQLSELPGEVWVSFVIRDRELLHVRPGTRLQAGDDILVQTEPANHPKLVAMFETPGP
ncbi:cell volume regulation protein A [Nakamurella sp. UYEF19]|uniref:potassium/proton antiporter n=1 Tax=Nakamurella sp. UYEF19 TaxID=1756392 RepID=UPI0033974A97